MEKHKSLGAYQRMLFMMGLVYIPLIFLVKPRILELNSERISLKIRLRRRTKNHLKSMYFGALAIGADVAAGMHIFYFCDELGVKPAFAFKSMKAEFVQRAESDVTFSCEDGAFTKDLVQLAVRTAERQNGTVTVLAKNTNGEIVARFEMELSVKIKMR